MWTITVYVPDVTARELSEEGPVIRTILDGVPELDFIRAAWWERSHTVRLGVPQDGTHPLQSDGI